MNRLLSQFQANERMENEMQYTYSYAQLRPKNIVLRWMLSLTFTFSVYVMH